MKAGDVAKAKQLFAPARAHYEAIEPVAESFGDLDPEIDARVNDVDAGAQWTGFHRIEKALWQDEHLEGHGRRTPTSWSPTSASCDALVRTRRAAAGAQIANGAVDLLDEVANSKITGEEDRYCHTDLCGLRGQRRRRPRRRSTCSRRRCASVDPALQPRISDPVRRGERRAATSTSTRRRATSTTPTPSADGRAARADHARSTRWPRRSARSRPTIA